ncbi:MAG TPA: substrate-binding domain-containing protein [Spirochaetia bacterium]|nr:substrate-binding domain-containing protein [Spirochaetia bacterium]
MTRIKWGLVLLGALLLSSCAKEAPKKAENSQIRIGFSATSDTFLLERWNRDIKVFTSEANELGAEVILSKSPGNALSQIPQIQYLLDQNIDVLVVIPQDMDLLSGVLKRAMDRGIPVLSYDRPIMGIPITGYVSFDNREVGRLLAGALLKKVPKGNYLIVNGSVRDNNSFELNRGAHEILDPHIANGDITVVKEIWLDLWSFDEAKEKIGEVLAQRQDIDAIFCANDQIADAAIRLLSERRLAGEVAVVGQDADLVSCQHVVEGTQLMTVYKPLPLLAKRAAELAVKMARGETPPPDQYIDNKSGTPLPFYVETPIAVFKEQMDSTIIKDGFHTREDVYRNIERHN